MSPHPALQVPEILSIIFGNFYQGDFTDEESLAALARSCKLFFEPAVSILWHRLDSLPSLFKVIPSFKLDESRDIYDFHDDVEPAHWLRLESYAAAVRELHVANYDDPFGFDGFVLVLAARHFQGRPMLPSLVTLTLDHPELIPTLPLLLSPTLRTISFCVDDNFSSGKLPYPLHKGFMKIISEQAPSIKKLVLPGFLSNRVSYNPILSLRNLHTLIISTSEKQSGNVPLDIIACCTSLVELKMNFKSASDASPPNLKFQLPCFQSLRSLGLTGASGLFINSILSMFIFIPLESVLIRLYCSDVRWRTITTNVAQWANTLQRFEFTVRSELMVMPRYSDLEPLLSCCQMRHLIVGHYDFPSSPSLCHDDIVEMATSWPELRELKFHLATVDVNLSSLTLLTEKLPNLRELSLAVDLSTLPRIVKHPRRTGQQLLKLDINHFSLGKSDPVTVADHLNNLFPRAAISPVYNHSRESPVHRLGRVLNLCQRACTRAGGV